MELSRKFGKAFGRNRPRASVASVKRVNAFAFNTVCFLGGAILIVAGWWISMLNISIDRYSGQDFTNFWTILGLVLIFGGAYLPLVLIKLREVRQSQQRSAPQVASGGQTTP